MLLTVLLAVAVLQVSASPAFAVTEAECQVRHAICIEACKGNKSCERRCDEGRRNCLRQAHQY
jgi:hypothetical protein